MNTDAALNAAWSSIVDIENEISEEQEVYIQRMMKFRKYLWVFGPKLTRDEAIAYLEASDIFHPYHIAKVIHKRPVLESIVRLCAASSDGTIMLDDEAAYSIRKYI